MDKPVVLIAGAVTVVLVAFAAADPARCSRDEQDSLTMRRRLG